MDDLEDSLDTYRATVERVLTEYAEFLTTEEDIVCETIFDRAGDHYLLVEIGWENGYRIYGPLLHIDICGGKLWIQNDGTEEGVAVDLVAANVPKDRIVLGFRHLSLREPASPFLETGAGERRAQRAVPLRDIFRPRRRTTALLKT